MKSHPSTERWILAAVAAIVLASGVSYANTFSVPFLYDDLKSIAENPTIRHLWPPWDALRWPHGRGLTVEGRPLLNLSLALNYAISGDRVWSYHALNLAIHLLAGLTLFGIVRRTIEKLEADRNGTNPCLLAFAIALLWTVHPLQTESVTYVIQRAESLMGLLYLLTLYCFIREWHGLSVLACLLGMATKEVMVSAPLMVLLYDRTFLAGTFREAWRLRRRIYLGLAATWILLGALVNAGGGNRGGSAGFDVGVTWWEYWLTQFQAVVHYLRLAIWPHPLVFDYGTFWVTDAANLVPFAGVLVPLVALTGVALWRWPTWGFLGAWFFAILAPTSLVPGTSQMIVEHRMYLALVPLIVAAVCGMHALRSAVAAPARIVLFVVAAAGMVALTAQRNADYASAVSLWADTVAKRPDNARAQMHLGYELAALPDRLPEAVAHYEQALRIDPHDAEAENNLANALAKLPGRMPEALARYQEALRINPRLAETHYNFANALAALPGRTPEAVAHYEAALQIEPDYPEARLNFANALAHLPGRMPEAVTQYERLLRDHPRDPEAHYNLANALATLPGRMPEAVSHYEQALKIKPDYAEAEVNLANAMTTLPGRLRDAVAHYEAAIRIKPALAEAHYNLANVLAAVGRLSAAEAHYEAVLRIHPGDADAQSSLAKVRAAERTALRAPP